MTDENIPLDPFAGVPAPQDPFAEVTPAYDDLDEPGAPAATGGPASVEQELERNAAEIESAQEAGDYERLSTLYSHRARLEDQARHAAELRAVEEERAAERERMLAQPPAQQPIQQPGEDPQPPQRRRGPLSRLAGFFGFGPGEDELDGRSGAESQRLLPYELLFPDGIMRLEDGRYSQTIRFEDVNYQAVRQDRQEQIAERWAKWLDSLPPSVSVQISLDSQHIRDEELYKTLMIADVPGDDERNELRRECNAYVESKLNATAKSMRRHKLITVTVDEPTHENAARSLALTMQGIRRLFAELGSETHILDGQERIDLISQYTRQDDVAGKFTYADLDTVEGLTTRDLCAPTRVERLDGSDLLVGNRFTRSYIIVNYGKIARDSLLHRISHLPYETSISMHIRPWDQGEAVDFVERRLWDVNRENAQWIHQASRPEQGRIYDEYTMPIARRERAEEAQNFRAEVVQENQHIFAVTTVVTVFASSEDELHKGCVDLESVLREKSIPKFESWWAMREESFVSTLPLGVCLVPYERNINTKPLAAFLPFTSIDVMNPGGVVCGVNSDTRNFIVYDQRLQEDFNSFCFGLPRSGKSMTRKLYYIQMHLRHPDWQYIFIDPEREFAHIVDALGGEVVDVSPSSSDHINPMEISTSYSGGDDGSNPVPAKVDFIQALVHMMANSVSDAERSALDAACQQAYGDWLATGDPADMPTLQDVYDYLMSVTGYTEPDARHLAQLLRRYVDGSFSLFNSQSTVDLDNNIIDFVIADLGGNLKPIAMLVLLDWVWVKVTQNRALGRNTILVIDELQIAISGSSTSANEEVIQWLDQFWTRGGKWGLYSCGITQNIDRLLDNQTLSYMIKNTPWLTLMEQSPGTAHALAQLLSLSPDQEASLINPEKGTGLMVIHNKVIPFDNTIDRRVCPKLFDLCTTRFEDTAARNRAALVDEKGHSPADGRPVGDAPSSEPPESYEPKPPESDEPEPPVTEGGRRDEAMAEEPGQGSATTIELGGFRTEVTLDEDADRSERRPSVRRPADSRTVMLRAETSTYAYEPDEGDDTADELADEPDAGKDATESGPGDVWEKYE